MRWSWCWTNKRVKFPNPKNVKQQLLWTTWPHDTSCCLMKNYKNWTWLSNEKLSNVAALWKTTYGWSMSRPSCHISQKLQGYLEKSLSDYWGITRFSFQISLYSVVNDYDNLTLHQKSLKALFHTPLHLVPRSTRSEHKCKAADGQ